MSSVTSTLNWLYDEVQRIVDSGLEPSQIVTAVTQLCQQLDDTAPEMQIGDELPDTYQVIKLYESDNVRINKVEMRAGTVIAPHDHPEMTAVLRLIRGYISLNIYEPSSHQSDYLENTLSLKLEAGDTSDLRPDCNNIHAFVVHENSVFIDIFTPYYSPERRISYYDLEPVGGKQYKIAQVRQP